MSVRATRTPTAAEVAVSDRVLVATTSSFPSGLVRVLVDYREIGGVLAVGAPAAGAVSRLRSALPDIVTGFDPAAYTYHVASPESPFAFGNHPSGQEAMFGADTLEAFVGESVADHQVLLSPTGVVPAGDLAALDAVLEGCQAVDHPALAAALPLPAEWLAGIHRAGLIERIRDASGLAVLILVGPLDPFENQDVACGLVELLSESGDRVLVHRTDQTAFHAIARGALAASIGTTASLRHTDLRRRSATRRRRKATPGLALFVSGIDEFRDLDELERWYGDGAPRCVLDGCCGRSLTDFDRYAAEDRDLAAGHNLASWMPRAAELLAVPARQRQHWLADYRRRVRTAYEELRASTGVRAIRPYAGARVWLDLDG